MKPVPFFSNTDNLHCFQASIRMVLKYFLPERDFSWPQLEEMSAVKPDNATWPQATMPELHNMGFEIAMVEAFDAHSFIEKGADYLKAAFGEEAAEWQINHSDIPNEQRIYKELLDSSIRLEQRSPSLDDIRNYLQEGYLIVYIVNSRRLNKKSGYVGHAVVVYELDEATITFHDPGLPAHEARQASHNDFVAAWADPNDQARNLIALKYKGTSV